MQLWLGCARLNRKSSLCDCLERVVSLETRQEEKYGTPYFLEKEKKGDVAKAPEVQKLGFSFFTTPSSSHQTASRGSNYEGPCQWEG